MHIESLNSIPQKDLCKPKELCSKWLYQVVNVQDPENKTLLRLMTNIEREYSKRIKVPDKVIIEYNRYRMCLLPNSDTSPFFIGEQSEEWEDEKYYTDK